MTLLIKALAIAALMWSSLFVTPTDPIIPVTPPAPQKDSVVQRFPGVFVTGENGQPQPLAIRKLDVDVEIMGTLARTTIDMTVYNPHDRVLEGEFSFPLNDGQTVARFALDINGKLREAVVVSKSKGRETFEEVIRTKIDPALLEWTRDNSFKTRIYPIPAKGTRRVVIAYEQTLTNTGRGLAYTIPFAYPTPPALFTFDCTVAGMGERPTLTGGGGRYLQFTPKGRQYTVRIAESKPKLDRPFTIDIPVMLDEHVISVNTFENTDYFGAFLTMAPELQSTPAPTSMTILWDASLSADHRDRTAEFEVLDALFTRLRSVNVRLVIFSDRVFSDRRYPVGNGNWDEVRRWIETTPNDGATQLGDIPFDVYDDMILLVSDGISTIGTSTPRRARVPVHVLSSGVPADHDVLHTIARESGGAVHPLGQDDPTDVVRRMLGSRRLITKIRVLDGRIEDIRPTGVIPVEHVTSITGRLLSESATLEVISSIDGVDERTDEITISASEHKTEGQTVARLWAMGELQRLSADRVRNADAILALGQRFTIVTPNTSLLVLERLEDYVRHNIQPPSTEPELLALWKNRRSRIMSDSLTSKTFHTVNVMASLERRRGLLMRPHVSVDTLHSANLWSDTTTRIITGGEHFRMVESLEELDYGSEDQVMRPASETSGTRVSNNGFTARGARVTSTGVTVEGAAAPMRTTRLGTSKQVLVDGLTVTDAFPGGFVGDFKDLSSSMPSPFAVQLATTQQREQWTDTLSTLKGADLYAAYLRLRPQYRTVTAFYLDVCDALRADQQGDLALRVLSNLAELKGEDARDLRILGHRLLQLSYNDLAISVFEHVLRIRDEEPQSYRDLALALTAARRFDEAARYLTRIIEKPWHNRFPEIELIAAMELSRLVKKYGAEMDTSGINTAYLLPVESDVRVVLTWDADNCDMDLWVTDPRGETCKYNNRDTHIGGHMSVDLTGGYGPEEFLLTKAIPGTYTVKVHYYGSRQQDLARPTTVQVAVFTRYGTDEERETAITLRLDGVSRVVDAGSFQVD